MKAISLWQPYATAIAIGLKKVETRSWKTAYQGRLAIHAAKRWTPQQQEFARLEQSCGRLPYALPLGCIVAVVNVAGCCPAEEFTFQSPSSLIECRYGDYSSGRFGWILTDVIRLDKPIPYSGTQGFFNVPDYLFPEFLREPISTAKEGTS